MQAMQGHTPEASHLHSLHSENIKLACLLLLTTKLSLQVHVFMIRRAKWNFTSKKHVKSTWKLLGFMMYPSKLEIFSSAMSDDLLSTIVSQEYILEGGACTDRTECCCFVSLNCLMCNRYLLNFLKSFKAGNHWTLFFMKSFQTQEAPSFTLYH
jgi:hypothetical protein